MLANMLMAAGMCCHRCPSCQQMQRHLCGRPMQASLCPWLRQHTASSHTCSWLSIIDSVTSQHASQHALGCRYVLPSLSLVPADAEASVRQAYAGIVMPMAAAAHRFLAHLQLATAAEQSAAQGSPAMVHPQPCIVLRTVRLWFTMTKSCPQLQLRTASWHICSWLLLLSRVLPNAAQPW